MSLDRKSCWIISDNLIGHENQSISLAAKLQLRYKIKKTRKKNFFKRNLSILFPSILINKNIYPPYPKVIISCGKNTAYTSYLLKKKLKNKILSIFIQKPPINLKNFDIVIAPKHDKCIGKNVITTNGALTKISQNYIKKIKKIKKIPTILKKKFIVVLFGGNSRHHKITSNILKEITDKLMITSTKYNYKILIFFSRRTGKYNENYLRTNLIHKNFIFISPKSKKINYLQALCWAKIIIVSSDSVSMVSDACSTGKPVYIINIPSKSKKFGLFIKNLINLKLIKFFNGTISLKNNKNALNDIETIVEEIKKKNFLFFK